MTIAVVGGGPAGLRAAEVAAQTGAAVMLFESRPSAGRKFLIAGKGGLNLTHDEAPDEFARRYRGPEQPTGIWDRMLAGFDPAALRAWAEGLGVETFVASTGRVYPRDLKAASLLRKWIHRLRELGVRFQVRHRLEEIECGRGKEIGLRFQGVEEVVRADAVVLALGGGSWPETGSDGGWVSLLKRHGVAIRPLAPANCGWEVAWPRSVLDQAEGQPLKNVAARAGTEEATGELLVTRYGLEGGVIYRLGSALREMKAPRIEIDFKPGMSPEQLERKLTGVRRAVWKTASDRWKLSAAARTIVESVHGPLESVTAAELARHVKRCVLELRGPRPLAEAISSAGGICWSELREDLMLHQLPGVFAAGEMLDWEAPTGGYLLQGAFATGTRAGLAAVGWAEGSNQ